MVGKLARIFRETWFFWIYFPCLGYLLGLQTETAQMSWRAETVSNLTFAFLVAFWVANDARRRARTMGYDFPALVFFIWPVFGPLYLFQTRGVRGFLSLLGFVGMCFIAAAAGAVIGAVTRG